MTSEFAAFDPLFAIACDPGFWSDFFFLTHSGQIYESISNYDEIVAPNTFHNSPGFEIKCCRVNFPVTDQRGLALDFSCSLEDFSLELTNGAGKRFRLGWDNLAHWHPHVLRWDELESISECLNIRDASFTHPGLPLLLLCRWAPITEVDDADHVLSLLRRACDRLGVLQLANSIFARFDRRGNGFEWRNEPSHGWIPYQDNSLTESGWRYKWQLYSLRSTRNTDFPFTELNAMLQGAREICDNNHKRL